MSGSFTWMEVQEEAAVLPKQRKRNDEPVERRADSRNGPAFDQDDGIDFAQDEDLLAHDIPYGWGKAAPAPAARPAETTPSPVRRRVKKPEPPCKATPEPASQVTPSIPAKRRSLDSASAVGNALRGVPGDQEAGGSLKAAVPEPAARRPAQVIGGQAGGASARPIGLFGNLPLSKITLAALDKAEYLEPTPVQAGVIARAIEGTDLMAQAQTRHRQDRRVRHSHSRATAAAPRQDRTAIDCPCAHSRIGGAGPR